jgi:hypothetical protein
VIRTMRAMKSPKDEKVVPTCWNRELPRLKGQVS